MRFPSSAGCFTRIRVSKFSRAVPSSPSHIFRDMEHVGASDDGAGLPAWAGAPDNVMPGAVPTEALLAASAKAVVWISILWAYPTGFQFGLSLRIREPQAHGNWASGPLFAGELYPETGALEWRPGERFHFALSFADGRTVDNRPRIDHAPPSASDPAPKRGIELRSESIRLSPQTLDELYWVWPLPPSGPIRFLCEWAAMGVGPTLVEVDAGPLRDASARSVVLWPLVRPT
jgi:hypothetical protein